MPLNALKPLVPPVLVTLARRILRPGIRFDGDYDSWEAALSRSGGYDALEIAERVAAATRKVISGQAAYERDSVLFDHVQYSWPTLAALLQVALERGSLRVVDVGGALGSSWRQNGKFLTRLSVPLTWHVVEQKHFVALGAKEFADAHLRFYGSTPEAAGEGVDVVLFSSSLCYVADPIRFVREASGTSAQFLIVDRLPTIAGHRDRIAVQYVTEPIYNASYPVRFFGRDALFSSLLSGWRVIERWDCDLQPDPSSRCQGFFLERT